MAKIRGLNHAAFRITDVKRACDFYEQVLGLEQIPRPTNMGMIGGAWYGVGNSALHLISNDHPMEGIDPTGPHVAIEVEDYEAAKAQLQRQGIEFREMSGTMFGSLLWVRDPDGNTIELRSAPKA